MKYLLTALLTIVTLPAHALDLSIDQFNIGLVGSSEKAESNNFPVVYKKQQYGIELYAKTTVWKTKVNYVLTYGNGKESTKIMGQGDTLKGEYLDFQVYVGLFEYKRLAANIMSDKEIKVNGRPTKYKEEYADLAYRNCLVYNSTDKQLAEYFNVEESTINNWKNKHNNFLVSIKKGKSDSDFDVVNSLRNRAVGYEFTEVKREAIQSAEDPSIVTAWKVTETKKHIPADTTANIYWTKNRLPESWGDRKSLDLKVIKSAEELTDDELLDIATESSLRTLYKAKSKRVNT